MLNDDIDTISAIATAPGEGSIGIVRLSGNKAIDIGDNLFRGINGGRINAVCSHQAVYGHIIEPNSAKIVDEVLVLVMRAPRSYTKEDVVEIHCHGGQASIKKVLDLTLQSGARLADPGEFTKRAFLNGRLDLAQAEAVIDIIRAKTDASLRMAVGHLTGSLSGKIRGLRQEILRMIAQLEAAIDFPEEDIEELAAQEVALALGDTLKQVELLLATAKAGRILRDGLETVIIGKPNVGKSSLLNALVGEKRAIVTDIPGTTRDIIEEYVNIRGIPLKIVDTAGIRDTDDVVEKIGVERAREIMVNADLILLLLDSSQPLSDEDREILDMLAGKQAVVLVNKSDLPARLELAEVMSRVREKKLLKISVVEGTGLTELEQIIVDMVYSGQVSQAEGAFVNNVRHANSLHQVKIHLQDVLVTINKGMPSDCIVVDLRAAWEKLGEITGDTVGEDIVDQIFSQFCIGK